MTRTDTGNGKQGFDGEVSNADERVGQVTLKNKNETANQFHVTEHNTSSGFPSLWSIDGNTGGQIDLTGSQELVDHDSIQPPADVTVTRESDGKVVTKGVSERNAISATPIEGLWRLCFECNEAWKESPQEIFSICPNCLHMTKLEEQR